MYIWVLFTIIRSIWSKITQIRKSEFDILQYMWPVTGESQCSKRNLHYTPNLYHFKQNFCFSLSCVFSFLITKRSFTNRIVTHRGLKALKKCFPAEMCLWAVIFQGFFASIWKLDSIHQPFQGKWNTNPCHWSYLRPTVSMKKAHYIVIFLEEALWLHLERAACPSTWQKPSLLGSIIKNITSYQQG